MLQTDLMNTRQPKNVLTKAQNRVRQTITPAHYCANLFDPRYRGNLIYLHTGHIEKSTI